MRRKPESAQNLLLVKSRVANSLPASNAVILFAPAAVGDGTPAFYPSPAKCLVLTACKKLMQVIFRLKITQGLAVKSLTYPMKESARPW